MKIGNYARAVLVLVFLSSPVRGQIGFTETFDDDPVAAGRFTVSGDASRFVHAPGSMTASYDTIVPTAMLKRPLGVTLAAGTGFEFEVDLVIHSAGFYADPNAFAQIAFGLINSQATGNDRVGGVSGDAFEIITVDYFPNESFLYGGPSLGPTMILAADGGNFFDAVQFDFGAETDMTFEGPLPTDTLLTFRLVSTFDAVAGTQTLTLRVSDVGGPLLINSEGAGAAFGGLDGDPTTIQTVVDDPTAEVDTFSILLWEDTFASGASTLVADVRFDEIRFEASVATVPAASDFAVVMLVLLIVVTGSGCVVRCRGLG